MVYYTCFDSEQGMTELIPLKNKKQTNISTTTVENTACDLPD